MSRQFWGEAVQWVTAAGATVANTTSETILFPNVTIPANYLQDGRVLRMSISGAYGTTSTPTITFRVRWGGVVGTVLAATGAYTTGSGVGGGASMTALFTMDILLQVRSNGASGTLFTNGEAALYTTGTASGADMPLVSGSTGGTTPVAVSADLTADTALSITVQWGTANSANSIRGDQYVIEALN